MFNWRKVPLKVVNNLFNLNCFVQLCSRRELQQTSKLQNLLFNSTQDWFNDEVAKAIKLREKRLKQFKSTKLHTDEDLYKEAKYHAVKLIKQKKSHFYKEKLKENIGKPKELWKALKSLGLPSKKGTISNICLKKDDKICFDDQTNSNTFKEFFCNLASDLVAKLPPPSKRFGLNTVRSYYQDILSLCVSYLNNKIATGFESGLHTGMILIDLQKAFDTINHEVLINKMEFLGFSKNVIL